MDEPSRKPLKNVLTTLINLLAESIFEQLSDSLCDTVLEQHGSRQMLRWLEQANVFVVSLDSKRQWYRYHALFAEALRKRLEQTQPDLMFALHHRASLWYAKHDRTTQAILHAFCAKRRTASGMLCSPRV
jgi:LuxR family maltose regulon positive regulatory protein